MSSTTRVGEQFDVAAAVEHAEFADLPHLWIVGWSFGTDLALMYGLEPSVEGIVLLSPPIRSAKPRAPQGLGRLRQASDGADS